MSQHDIAHVLISTSSGGEALVILIFDLIQSTHKSEQTCDSTDGIPSTAKEQQHILS